MTSPLVGVGCLVRRSDELLLLRRHGAHGEGTWSPPGGNLDFGESPGDCAARETMEETGIHVSGVRFRGVTNDVFEPEGKHYVTLWFEADYLAGDAEVRAPDEHSEVGWFREERLPEPLFLSFRNLVDGIAVR